MIGVMMSRMELMDMMQPRKSISRFIRMSISTLLSVRLSIAAATLFGMRR